MPGHAWWHGVGSAHTVLTSHIHFPLSSLLSYTSLKPKLHTLHDILPLSCIVFRDEHLRTWRVRPSRNAHSQAYRPEGLPRFSEPYREYGCWPFLGVRYGYIGPAREARSLTDIWCVVNECRCTGSYQADPRTPICYEAHPRTQ